MDCSVSLFRIVHTRFLGVRSLMQAINLCNHVYFMSCHYIIIVRPPAQACFVTVRYQTAVSPCVCDMLHRTSIFPLLPATIDRGLPQHVYTFERSFFARLSSCAKETIRDGRAVTGSGMATLRASSSSVVPVIVLPS